MSKINFNNTEIAFTYRNNIDLIRAFNMFYLMKYNWLVRVGTNVAQRWMDRGVTLPITIAMKPTVYRLFCGGESLEEAKKRIDKLFNFGVRSILDYGVEGKETDVDFDRTAAEVRKAIIFAANEEAVPIVSSKFTGLIKFAILEKLHAGKELSREEAASFQRSKDRIEKICQLAYDHKVGLFVDAEETWIQQPLDDLIHEMMRKYNKEQAIVYNTVQLYRKDRLAKLKRYHLEARADGYIYGIKLVRGAYMEKEGERAEDMHYENPIHSEKSATDKDFNLAIKYCMENISDIYVCVATHNEESCQIAADLMKEHKIAPENRRVIFSQLFGMGDHISFNMASEGFNVAKYMPYGPVKDVVPYLVRRAQENTSVAGQMGRELSLLKTEMRRRSLMF